MIIYQERLKSALQALQKALTGCHFDLLVRELKLPLLYFHEPGFVYYGHSIDSRLERAGKKAELMVRLFCLNQSVALEAVTAQLLSSAVVDELGELGLLVVKGGKLSTDYYCIVPFLGNYFIATYGTARSIGAYLGRQSYILGTTLFTRDYESFLDMGAGCGILGILAARQASRVAGVDILSEAVEVARANAALNNVDDRVSFHLGDMYEPVKGQQFDVVFANAPFVALPERYSDMVAISSGEDGLGFLRRLIEGMFAHEPKLARMLANGLGNENGPLLFNYLKSIDLGTRGYRAKLLVYTRGLLDDSFTAGNVRLVEGAYRDRGEEIAHDQIMAEMRALYEKLGVDYYYGIILEIERAAVSSIEVIDISNQWGLNMSPRLRNSVEIASQRQWLAQLHTTTLALNEAEKEQLCALMAGETDTAADRGQQEQFYARLARVLGAGKRG